MKPKEKAELLKRMIQPITEEQISKVLDVNECLTPEHWNKGMYDSFMLGIGFKDIALKEQMNEVMKIIDDYTNEYDDGYTFKVLDELKQKLKELE